MPRLISGALGVFSNKRAWGIVTVRGVIHLMTYDIIIIIHYPLHAMELPLPLLLLAPGV